MSNNRSKLYLVMLLSILSTLIAEATIFFLLYQTGLDLHKKTLFESSASQARLLETISREYLHKEGQMKTSDAVVRQIVEALHKNPIMVKDKVTEVVIASQQNNTTKILFSQCTDKPAEEKTRSCQIPMALALSKKNGMIEYQSKDGKSYIATHHFLPTFQLGLVHRISIGVIRNPYIWTGLISAAGGMLLILLSATLMHRILSPIIHCLEEKNRFIEKIFFHQAEGTITFDIEGRIQNANTTTLSIFKYTLESLRQTHINSLIPGISFRQGQNGDSITFTEMPDAQLYRNLHNRILALGKNFHGEELILELSPSQIDTQKGTLFIVMIRDISADIDKERRLLLASKIFATSQEGILITEPDGTILEANDTFLEISGYSREEIIERKPSIFHSGWHDADFYHTIWKDINQENSWIGEIWNRKKNGEIYPKLLSISAIFNEAKAITNYIAIYSDISCMQQQGQKQLRRLAHYDTLTNLPNRSLFYDRLGQILIKAKREQNKFGLIFLDLDGFKEINDLYGHKFGDITLQQVAKRLNQTMRESDTLSRLGGDEFTILIPDLETEEHLHIVARKVIQSFIHPLLIDDKEIYITASLGISIFPIDGQDAETLLRKADSAMYFAKENGKNRYHFFSNDLLIKDKEKKQIESLLRRALENEELYLDYQPILDHSQNHIIGAEALLRWKNPEIGAIPPDTFIPVAEDSGLIYEIGAYVIRQSSIQAAIWRKENPDFTISVNLSIKQLRNPNFLNNLKSMIEYQFIDPTCLNIELSEPLVINNFDRNIAIIQAIHKLGFAISLDGFGTGCASLQILQKLPIQTIKIDQSIIANITSQKYARGVVSTIMALGESLQFSVVAEGVENEAQYHALQELHCSRMQGFYFSRPVPAEEFTALLKKTIY